MKSIFIMTAAFALALIAIRWVGGCGANSLEQWKNTRDQVSVQLIAATRNIHEIQSQLDALPEGEIKTRAQNALRQAQDLTPLLSDKLASLDRMIQSASSGDASTLGAGVAGLLTGLPVIGPFAGLIGLLAGMGFGAWQRVKREKEVNQALAAARELEEKLKNAKAASPQTP